MIPIPFLYTPYLPLYTFSNCFYPEISQRFYQQLDSQMHGDDSKNDELKQEGIAHAKTEVIEYSKICASSVKNEQLLEQKQKFRANKKQKNDRVAHVKSHQNFQENKQKQYRHIDGRNANSNLLRIFFRRLEQVLQFSPQIIDSIIRKNRFKISTQKFTEWLQINKAEYTHYIRLSCVKKLFICNRVNRSGKFQTKIMRILLNDFLRKEAVLFYLTSKRIKSARMVHNYRSIRNILKEIVEQQIDL